MKIRKKITFWISGTALISTIAFSCVIFFELMEEPFKFIDSEMQHMATALVKQMENPATGKGEYDLSNMPYNPDKYWIKVTDKYGGVLYRSLITQYADIALSTKKTSYMTEKTISRSRIWLGQDDKDDILFRVMVIETRLSGRPITIQIGKPIENLEEELIALARYIGISLLLCTMTILFFSYKLSEKILEPVVAITRRSKEISERSLHKRIPLSRSRDEIFDLSVSLNKMFDRLQYSFERQKEFIGNASHELKSPITLLMLAQEEMLLNDDLPHPVAKKLAKQLDTARRMSHMIKNLLDLSRLEQQETLARKPVDLAALVTQVLDDYEELFLAGEVTVQKDLPEDLALNGDQEKLFRLLVNLVDNSLRYNFETGGRILVKGEKTSRGIVLEIWNTGHPIPEKDLARVFDQFFRVEKSRSEVHGGSGLGLPIVKKIIELHEGSVCITNEPEQFIRVSIFFPFA